LKPVSIALLALALVAGDAAGQPAPPPLLSHGFLPAERTPDVAVRDLSGRATSLHKFSGSKGAVFITRDLECPVSQRYLPRIVELARRYESRGFRFVIVDVTPHGVAEAKKAAPKGLATILDSDGAFRAALRPRSTAEAFVIDRAGTLRYRGAIDDQYGLSHQRDKVKDPWLIAALDAVARGRQVPTPMTEAKGCPLGDALTKPGKPVAVTFHNRISRLLQAKCQACHRAGGLAPMPLETYPQVAQRNKVIEFMVESGRMPPWFAQKGLGHWANDRSLTEREKTDLLGWLRGGAPEGDRREAPAPARFPDEWTIGKPDAIVRLPEVMKVPAQGIVDYKYIYVPTDFGEDKWVTAIEVRPTQPRVVHHVIALLEEPRTNLQVDSSTGFFGITAPGAIGIVFPEGTGKRIPRGSRIVFEVHYQPNGTATTDRTEIGLRFAPKPLREIRTLSAVNQQLVIPPGAPNHLVRASYTFKEPGRIMALLPHMHLRGKAFRYDLEMPGGRTVPLLNVPRYDFNWQMHYELAEPQAVPAGAKLVATAWYDNSKANPWNPDPAKEVRWGPQSTDEMMIGYFDFLAD
jgi:hypothetical protein